MMTSILLHISSWPLFTHLCLWLPTNLIYRRIIPMIKVIMPRFQLDWGEKMIAYVFENPFFLFYQICSISENCSIVKIVGKSPNFCGSDLVPVSDVSCLADQCSAAPVFTSRYNNISHMQGRKTISKGLGLDLFEIFSFDWHRCGYKFI